MSTLQIIDPADGTRLQEVAVDDVDAVAARVARARAAQPAWGSLPLAARKECIARFRLALLERAESLAQTLTAEVGKPIRQSRSELAGVIGRIDFFLEAVDRSLAAETVYSADGMTEVIGHEPLGVVANISAWNYPYFVGVNAFVPALLAGNAVLYKPSEHATLSGIEIGRLLHAAGVPDDVFAVVVGGGPVGAALLDQDVDGVFFTGSHATGTRIAAVAGPRLIRMQLELGGKDPVWVRADADVSVAAESLADGAMYNAGQSCCSVERIYVHESIHDRFVERFVKTVQDFRIGAPTDEATYVGPLARAAQREVLDAQVADARARGARVLVGGARLPGPGNWYAPTVLVDVDHTMTLMREESFGPIIGIQKVSDDEAAIALLNDTRYGLTAGVYTRDESAARALLARIRAGSVYWNCCDRVSPRLPWSGRGHSGIGVTLSTYGIQSFTRLKAWHLRSPG